MDEHRGVATGLRGALGSRVLGAWDALLGIASELPPDRLGELAVLGSWPERPFLARLLAQAAAAADGDNNAAFHAAPAADTSTDDGADTGAGPQDHRDDGPTAVLAALAEARRRTAAALDAIAERPELALVELDSPVGPLPLLTQIHAGSHDLAVAALRCAEPAELPEAITDAAIAALVDVVGALAWRQGIRTVAGVWGGGTSGWVFRSDARGWQTATRSEWRDGVAVPGIEGAAATVLGVPTGRGALPVLIARGEIRLHRIGALMALAPLVEQVPGLPGGAMLRRAVGMVALLARLPGRR